MNDGIEEGWVCGEEAKNDWMAKQDNDIESWIRTVESLQKVVEPMRPNDR